MIRYGLRQARFYSTEKNAFVSSLMQRIDSINLRTKKLSEENKRSEQKATAQTSLSKKLATKKLSATQQQHVASRKPEESRIKVKDHPLSSGMFNLMDENNFAGSSKVRAGRFRQNNGARRDGAKSGSARSDAGPRRDGVNAGARRNSSQAGPKKPFQRKTGTRTSAPSKKAGENVQRVVLKELVAEDVKPAVNGDTFFYGKPATLATSVTSSVAAVAKEALLESKYPYKLPKSIIDKLDSSYAGNSFIAQNDYNLDVDAQHLAERVKRVVKGEAEVLDLGKKPSDLDRFTARELMRSGDLSLQQKQRIFDVASGLKTAKLLVEGAAWNK